jgi:hypothetical protein
MTKAGQAGLNRIVKNKHRSVECCVPATIASTYFLFIVTQFSKLPSCYPYFKVERLRYTG